AQCALDARLIERARALLDDARDLDDDHAFVHVTLGWLALSAGDVEQAFACAGRARTLGADDARAMVAALDLEARTFDIAGRRADAVGAYSRLANEADAAGLVDVRLRALVCLSEFELFDGCTPVRMFEARDLARNSGALVEHAWAELNLVIAL